MLKQENERWIDHEMDFSRKSVVVTKNSPEGTGTDVQTPYSSCLQQIRVKVKFSRFKVKSTVLYIKGIQKVFYRSDIIKSLKSDDSLGAIQ